MLEISINDKKKYSVDNTGDTWVLDEKNVACDIQVQPNGLISILYNNKSYTATVDNIDLQSKKISVTINGNKRELAVSEPMDQLLASMGLDMSALQKAEPVKAPMPGMILKVMVEPGQEVKKGDGLLVLEAMKMENIIKAASDATVKAINIKEKTAVEKGAILIELE